MNKAHAGSREADRYGKDAPGRVEALRYLERHPEAFARDIREHLVAVLGEAPSADVIYEWCREAGKPRRYKAPFGIPADEIERALEASEKAGSPSLSPTQREVLMALWGIGGRRRLLPRQLAARRDVSHKTIYEVATRALRRLQRAGMLSSVGSLRSEEHRQWGRPPQLVGFDGEQLVAAVELAADAGLMEGGALTGREWEVLRRRCGLDRDAESARPTSKTVARELGISGSQEHHARWTALRKVSRALGAEVDWDGARTARMLEDAAVGRLREALDRETKEGEYDHALPGRAPVLLRGYGRREVEIALRCSKGYLSRRERVLLHDRCGLGDGVGGARSMKDTADAYGFSVGGLKRLQAAAAEKLARLIRRGSRPTAGSSDNA